MADYITKVMTAKGPKQIDYNALANLPDLSKINTSEYDLLLRLTPENNVTSITASDIEIVSGNVLETYNKVSAGIAVRIGLLHAGVYSNNTWDNLLLPAQHIIGVDAGVDASGVNYWGISFDNLDDYIYVRFTPLVSNAIVFASKSPKVNTATNRQNGLMSASDKAKLDSYDPTEIIVHNSTTNLPAVVNGALLIAYDV